jgi:proteasome lid subunit RPN8/RPN11
MKLEARVQMEMVEHAQRMFPYEGCGLVIDGEFYPVPNEEENPELGFRIDPRLTTYAQENYKDVMIFHSHPKGPNSPTESDMRSWLKWGSPWVICSLNGGANEVFILDDFLDYPLKGRPFRHGVFDCYSLCRSYYWQTMRVKLPDFPRSDNWWAGDQNLYEDNFRSVGFRVLDPTEPPREGDAFMMCVMSKKINHAGIYLGQSTILHHLMNRLSREEPLGGWGPRVIRWVRYEGAYNE